MLKKQLDVISDWFKVLVCDLTVEDISHHYVRELQSDELNLAFDALVAMSED